VSEAVDPRPPGERVRKSVIEHRKLLLPSSPFLEKRRGQDHVFYYRPPEKKDVEALVEPDAEPTSSSASVLRKERRGDGCSFLWRMPNRKVVTSLDRGVVGDDEKGERESIKIRMRSLEPT